MTAHDAQLLSQDAHAEVTAANLLERLDLERLNISNRLAVDSKRRADLGQFFTPASVAHFLAAMHGLAVSWVTVRNQRPRWGSCGRNGHITLKWSKHPDVWKSAASKAVDNRANRCLDELEHGSDQWLARSYFRVNPVVGTAG